MEYYRTKLQNIWNKAFLCRLFWNAIGIDVSSTHILSKQIQ